MNPMIKSIPQRKETTYNRDSRDPVTHIDIWQVELDDQRHIEDDKQKAPSYLERRAHRRRARVVVRAHVGICDAVIRL